MNRFVLRRLTWLDARASEAEAAGDAAAALALRRDHCAQVEDHLGQGHPAWSEALIQLARCAQTAGCPDEAEGAYRQLVAALEAEPAENREEKLARVLNAPGVCLLRQDRAAEAIEPLGRALGLSRRLLGESDPRLAALHDNLGSALHSLGRLDDALRCYHRALGIHEQGPEDLGQAHCLADLAELLAALDDPEADTRAGQALGLFRRLQADDPVGLAHSLDRLAGLATKRGQTGEAITLLEEAAELLRPLPSQAQRLATCLDRLGLLNMGRR